MLGLISDWFEALPCFPWLDVPYCIMMAVFLREQKGKYCPARITLFIENVPPLKVTKDCGRC